MTAKGVRPSGSRLEKLLQELDSRGGGLILRPSGAEVFIPNEFLRPSFWRKGQFKRRSGESFAELAVRAISVALELAK